MDKDLYKKYTDEIIEKLVNDLKPTAEEIDKNLKEGVGLYGAAFWGEWALQYLQSIEANIPFCIDKDDKKIGTKLCDIEIISPSDTKINDIGAILIVSRSAVKQILPLYEKTHIIMSFYGYYLIKNYDSFIDVRDNYLEDEKSKYVFNALLYAMLTGSNKSCREVMEKDEYFSLPEFSGNLNEIFVDAGAFVGDSVEHFIWNHLGSFKHIYAFEPSKKQFVALEYRTKRLLEEWALEPDTISLVKAGLSNKEDNVYICTNTQALSSHALSTHTHTHTHTRRKVSQCILLMGF